MRNRLIPMTVHFDLWHFGLDRAQALDLRDELNDLVARARFQGDFDERKISRVQELRAALHRVAAVEEALRRDRVKAKASRAPRDIPVFES